MAEQIRYNQLYDSLTPAEQQEYAGYKTARNLTGVQTADSAATGTNFPDIYAAEQAAEATKPNMWNPLNWIFTPAESAMTTAEERAAIERSSADIERDLGYDYPGYDQFKNPQQYYMENRPAYGYDSDWEGPIGATGRRPDDGGYIEYQEPFEHPYGVLGRRYSPEYLQRDAANKGFLTYETENDPVLQRALINRNRQNLYGNEGITGLDVQETISPAEDTITAEEQIMTRPDFGRITPISEGIREPNFLQRMGQKLGMTQVSPADRAANKQFMEEQGIGRDPITGRMTSGDFVGQNAPGTSGWGSKDFNEMRERWLEKFGDVEYSRTPAGLLKKRKQDRLKKEQAAYNLKIKQQAVAEKIRQDALRGAGAYSSQVQLDPGGGGTWHQQTAAKEAAGEQVAGPGFGKGAYFYQGGRVGYNTGGRVGILAAF